MSNDITYACTVLHALDAKGNKVTYQSGDVIRRDNCEPEAWTDCIILGFSSPRQEPFGDVFVKLARPYAYASCIGTTGPGVLTGVETFAIEASKLCYEQVVSRRPMVSGSVLPIDRGYKGETIDATTNPPTVS